MYRFKTGTPARIAKKSIDFSKMEEQKGDEQYRSVFLYDTIRIAIAEGAGIVLADLYE